MYLREDLFNANQRILELGDKNKYYVTRSDFPCPELYQLNILKPNSRVKYKAFLPKQNRTNLQFLGNVRQPYPFVPLDYEV